MQSIQNKINELKESLDSGDVLTTNRIQSKITAYENEMQFIKTHPRSIVPSPSAEKKNKRNSIQKKRWSLPSGDALAALGDNASNNKRWSIGSSGGEESGGEDDEILSGSGSEMEETADDEIFEKEKHDPTFQDISNRFKGLLPTERNHSPPRRPELPSLEPIISKAQSHPRRLSLNPYVLQNLSNSPMPTSPLSQQNSFDDQQPHNNNVFNAPTRSDVPSFNQTVATSNHVGLPYNRSANDIMHASCGTHVSGFYPPPNQHHSSQFQVRMPEREMHQREPYRQQQYSKSLQLGQQHYSQSQDLQQPYKPPQLTLPQRAFIAQPSQQQLPSLHTLNIPQNKLFTPIEEDGNSSPLNRGRHSLPSLPKFNQLENEVDQYQRMARHHSPQYIPRSDPFAFNHDPFIKQHVPATVSLSQPISLPPVSSPPMQTGSSMNVDEENTKEKNLNFIERIFRKQIPFFKKRNTSNLSTPKYNTV